MAIRKLEKSEWETYFSNWDKKYRDGQFPKKEVQIEIINPEIGDQVETQWQKLVGLAYDTKDDDFEVVAERHDHLIHKPTEIYVDEENGDLKVVEVIQWDGTKHIISLRPSS
ncbi:MAG TPA: hypothetical protein EYH43_03080 [Persephonella sp.]|nr:hypothetical protein [Hydrogenothermaceae bacterium]HIQ24946.1 hypothetical protein [Persephonella sp.]